MESLKREEALKQGYTLCGYADKEWQSLMSIKDLSEVDFQDEEYHGKIVLADKNGYSPSVDEKSVKELVADYALDMHTQENQDDTDEVYQMVMEVDFSNVITKINNKLSTKVYYKLTDIQLKL